MVKKVNSTSSYVKNIEMIIVWSWNWLFGGFYSKTCSIIRKKMHKVLLGKKKIIRNMDEYICSLLIFMMTVEFSWKRTKFICFTPFLHLDVCFKKCKLECYCIQIHIHLSFRDSCKRCQRCSSWESKKKGWVGKEEDMHHACTNDWMKSEGWRGKGRTKLKKG